MPSPLVYEPDGRIAARSLKGLCGHFYINTR
jgi:hypothetical protein